MKRRLLFPLLALFGGYLFAQTPITGVSMNPQNKVAVLEEFTGVRCTYCPDGHTILEQIMTTYGSNVVTISYHPDNSSLTGPYAGDPDLQRTYPNQFYTTPYCGTSRYMPSSFINRRLFGAERLQGRTTWSGHVANIITESSPVNAGVIGNYDENSQELTVTAEFYYTAAVTDPNAVYVLLMQDGIVVGTQSGATGSYTQNRVFREAMTAQWGDNVTTTTQGTLARFDYTFNNASMQYPMQDMQVIAFIENKTTGEVYTGAVSNVTLNSVGVQNPNPLQAFVYPNPTADNAFISFTLPAASNVSWELRNVYGAIAKEGVSGMLPAGKHVESLQTDELAAGVYFVTIKSELGTVTRRLVIQ